MDSNVIWAIIGVSILIILASIISQLRNDMMRMQRTLDRIAKEVGVPDIVTKEEKEELRRLISEGKRVEAIKRHRMLTGFGLKESKEYIDGLKNDMIGMQSTLDMITKEVRVPGVLTKEEKDELIRLISEGKEIKAIKRYRTITGIGLKESKEYIDGLRIYGMR